MKVAHFVQRYPPAFGGSEAYFARLSQYLAEENSVTVLTTTAIDLEAFWKSGRAEVPPGKTQEGKVEVCRFPIWRTPARRYVLRTLSLYPNRAWQCLTLPCNPISWAMKRYALETPATFDVVHATAFPYAWPIYCGLRLARRCGAAFFLTPFLHSGDPRNPKNHVLRSFTAAPMRFLLEQADGIFVQTYSEKEVLLRLNIRETKIHLQGMGVDARECTGGSRDDFRQQWQLQANEVVIGHLANNSEEKGTVDLLRSAQLLWQQGRSFTVALAGPVMPNFRNFWERYRSTGRILRLGILPEEKKKDFFAGIDVFVLPSACDSFGLVLLEASANGLCNVGYRAGGVAEVIRHEHDGLLVECGNVESLATALDRLLLDPVLRNKLGREGQTKVERHFGWHDKLSLVENLYRKAKKGKHPL